MSDKQDTAVNVEHGAPLSLSNSNNSQEIAEESLNDVFDTLRQEVDNYNDAGLTQISAWL